MDIIATDSPIVNASKADAPRLPYGKGVWG